MEDNRELCMSMEHDDSAFVRDGLFSYKGHSRCGQCSAAVAEGAHGCIRS